MLRGLLFITTLIVHFFVAANSENPDKLVKQGLKYRNLNKFEIAEQKYKEALKIAPDHFQAHFQLGLLYKAAFFDRQKALDQFLLAEEVMKADTVYELYLELGESYHYFEHYQKAIDHYDVFRNGVEEKDFIGQAQIQRKIDQCNFALTNTYKYFDGMVKNVGGNVNSNFSEYVPVFVVKDSALLFTKRGTENLGDYYWDNMYYEDMYVSYLEGESFSPNKTFNKETKYTGGLENSKMHESVVEINHSEDTLIVFQNNHLFYSVYDKDHWTAPVEFEKEINIGAYQRHATLNKSGDMMIFSSNAKQGYGGLDLYMSRKDENGNWGEAINLGSEINTAQDEDSPFLRLDNRTLFFSSTGHDGYGAYDIFMSSYDGKTWTKPKNVGVPMNSPANDIYYREVDNSNSAYMASDRKGGNGNMDIYQFAPYGIPEFKDCEVVHNKTYKIGIDAEQSVDIEGERLLYRWDMDDGSYVMGRSIKHTYVRPGTYNISLDVIDSISGTIIKDEELISVEGDLPVVLGEGELHIEPSGPDTVQLGAQEYFGSSYCQLKEGQITDVFWKRNDSLQRQDSILFSFESLGSQKILMEVIARLDNGEEIHYCATKDVHVVTEEDFVAIQNNKPDSEKPLEIGSGLDLDNLGSLPDGVEYKLENIYFSFDKHNIRRDARLTLDKNIAVLLEHDKLAIKVVGHTDAMGTDGYNIKLSERRAKSAVKYLVKNGVSLDRIMATLYEGEKNPAAPNVKADGTDNPKGRQLNRRVEFYVIGTIK